MQGGFLFYLTGVKWNGACLRQGLDRVTSGVSGLSKENDGTDRLLNFFQTSRVELSIFGTNCYTFAMNSTDSTALCLSVPHFRHLFITPKLMIATFAAQHFVRSFARFTSQSCLGMRIKHRIDIERCSPAQICWNPEHVSFVASNCRGSLN